jgi:hypothetical protein
MHYVVRISEVHIRYMFRALDERRAGFMPDPIAP